MFFPPPAAPAPLPLAGHTWSGDAGRVDPFLSPQVTDDALVYSTFLLHNPRPAGNLSILRTNRAEVPIECRYPRSVWPPLAQRPLGKPGSAWQWGCEEGEGLRLWSPPSVLVGVGVALRPLLGAPETGRGHSCLLGEAAGLPLPLTSERVLSRAGVGSKL